MFDPLGPLPSKWPEQRLFIGRLNHLGSENLKRQIAQQPDRGVFHSTVISILDRMQEENYAIGLAEGVPIQAVAWAIRNLSELRVWLRFVCRSSTNLERFTNDFYTVTFSNFRAALRLVDDLGKRVPGPEKISPAQHRFLADINAERGKAGLSDATPLLAKTYAAGVKLDKEYEAITALTSPLIHPSAISVLQKFDINSYRQQFEVLGLVLASDIILDARGHIDEHGYRPG